MWYRFRNILLYVANKNVDGDVWDNGENNMIVLVMLAALGFDC